MDFKSFAVGALIRARRQRDGRLLLTSRSESPNKYYQIEILLPPVLLSPTVHRR